jgi:hypothetical protein
MTLGSLAKTGVLDTDAECPIGGMDDDTIGAGLGNGILTGNDVDDPLLRNGGGDFEPSIGAGGAEPCSVGLATTTVRTIA